MDQVEAVLFDLDNTLLGSDKLEAARKNRDTAGLEKLLPEIKLFRKMRTTLEAVARKGIPLGIVTNSPRWYTERILSYFDIAEFFQVVITYDEVKPHGIKPHAYGINLACQELKIGSKSNVLFIGDHQNDIEASYASGVVPLAPTWAKTKIAQMPVCVVSTSEFIEQLGSPSNLRLLAEAAADNENLNAIKGKKFYFVPLNMDGEVVMPGRNKLELITFGRYFTNKSEITSTLRASHKLSREISSKDAKENQETYTVPEYWSDLLGFVLERIGSFIYRGESDFDIVTVIPSKQEKPPRLEQLLSKVENQSDLPYTFIPDLFYFEGDAKSLKTLGGSDNRNREVERTLKFNGKYSKILDGKRVIVIDDVITTGASFKRARRLLESNNAERFLGISIAKTVHAIGQQKDCPKCGRPMRVNDSKFGIPFWGCSGYFEHIEPCSNKESVEVKDCPCCDNKLVKKNGQYGFYLAHDKIMHGGDCNHSESC